MLKKSRAQSKGHHINHRQEVNDEGSRKDYTWKDFYIILIQT